ncbi:TPA: hypothetical protein I4G64_06070 [Enterobacter cloacae]|nr:hypothetical protein [Enterobacter pasteurii]
MGKKRLLQRLSINVAGNLKPVEKLFLEAEHSVIRPTTCNSSSFVGWI